MANHNMARLSEDIKREISSALSLIADPRVKNAFISVTKCEVTSDLSFCKVYFSALQNAEEALVGLKAAGGFFKKQIAGKVKMRKMPELIFVQDTSLEYYNHIDEVLKKLPKSSTDTEEN